VKKKVIYIAGPITGVPRYWEAFESADDVLTSLGYIVLTPSRLPEGMSAEQYARIDFAMIDSADAVVLLPGSKESKGARLERSYCDYIGKPWTYYPAALLGANKRASTGLDALSLRLGVLTNGRTDNADNMRDGALAVADK